MDRVQVIFLGVLLIIAAYAVSVVWSRRETRVRLMAVLGVVAAVPLLIAGAVESLGWHRPIWGAWELTGSQRVLSHKLVRGEAIYLYLDVGRSEPRAIVLPWDDKRAAELQRAMRESHDGRSAMMRFDHSWSLRPPKFYPAPQPVLPMPKGDPPPDPRRYDREA